MKILAIESSCDETAAAVIGDGVEILSNVVVSQIDIFAAYGGVIPEVAARSHLEAILPVVQKALDDAGCTKDEIDYIAVTYAPGLLGSLLIGTLTARMLAILWGKPLYAVHHLKSHIYANWLCDEVGDQSKAISEPVSSSPSSLRSDSWASSRKSEQAPFCSIPTRFVTGEPRFARSPLVRREMPSAGVASEKKKDFSFPSSPTQFAKSFDEDSSLLSTSENPSLYHAQFRLTCAADVSNSTGEFRSPSVGGDGVEFPLLALVISGGHTQIIYMPEHNQFEIIGTTRDDAVGECFDKVAKVIGLLYPGGPSIANCANNGDAEKYKLPHPKVEGLDFSFSGLKTAVLRAVQAELGLPITTPSYELAGHLSEQQRADFAASFQVTACEILLEKMRMALAQHPEVKSIVFAGGVSANQVLRKMAEDYFRDDDVEVYFPAPKYAGDNAAMVGAAAYYEILSGVEPVDPYKLNILPRTPIK